jgi:hypothetical protein
MTTVARSSRDVDRARALHAEIKQILESRTIEANARNLEDVQRLCGMAKATLDDRYSSDVMRAIAACVESLFAPDKAEESEDSSMHALIQSLLAVYESRLQELERRRRPVDVETDARTGLGDRRHAQRRNYVTRPSSAAGQPRARSLG